MKFLQKYGKNPFRPEFDAMLFFERYNRLRLQRLEYDYLVDRRGYKIVYTDGSSLGNHRRGTRFSGSATFWAPRNWTSSESQSPYSEENTNQRAEIRAVLHAMQYYFFLKKKLITLFL